MQISNALHKYRFCVISEYRDVGRNCSEIIGSFRNGFSIDGLTSDVGMPLMSTIIVLKSSEILAMRRVASSIYACSSMSVRGGAG